MTILAEIDAETRKKLQTILGTADTGNTLKNIQKKTRLLGLGIFSLMIISIVGSLVYWLTINSNNTSNISQIADEGSSESISTSSRLSNLINKTSTVETNLPREHNGEFLITSVYGMWFGTIQSGFLGGSSKILDGVALIEHDKDLVEKFDEKWSTEYSLVAFNDQDISLSEAPIGFHENSTPNNKFDGDWLSQLWMPSGTTSVALVKDKIVVDRVYVRNEKPIIDNLKFDNEINSTQEFRLDIGIKQTNLPQRGSLIIYDQIRTKNYIIDNYIPIDASGYKNNFFIDSQFAQKNTRLYLIMYVSTPFTVSQVKSNDFRYQYL